MGQTERSQEPELTVVGDVQYVMFSLVLDPQVFITTMETFQMSTCLSIIFKSMGIFLPEIYISIL